MNLETLYEKMEYGPAPESPNNAVQWLKDHQHKFSLFINGKWTESSKKNNFESINPATGKSLASISEASKGRQCARNVSIRWPRRPWLPH